MESIKRPVRQVAFDSRRISGSPAGSGMPMQTVVHLHRSDLFAIDLRFPSRKYKGSRSWKRARFGGRRCRFTLFFIRKCLDSHGIRLFF